MSFNAIISADVKNFEAGIAQASQSIAKFEQTVGANLKKVGDNFQNIGKKMSLAITAPLTAMGVMAVKNYGIQEQAERKLAAAIRATGGDVDVLSTRFKKFASDLQEVTTVGDETTLGMLQMAQTMGLTAGQSERAVKNAIAMESAFNVSAESAMRYTAALEDGDATMLKRYIPALKTIEDESLLAAKAQEILGNAFEVAKEDALTFTGQTEQLSNSFGDLMEDIGKIIAEAIAPLVKWAKSAVERFKALDDGTKKLIVTVAGIAAAIGPLLLGLGAVLKLVPLLVAGFTAIKVATTAMLGPIGLIAGAVALAVAAFVKYRKGAKGAKDEVKKLSDEQERFNELATSARSIEEQMQVVSTLSKRQVDALKDRIKQQLNSEEDYTTSLLTELKKRIKNDETISELRVQLDKAETGEIKAGIQARIKNRERDLAEDLAVQRKAQKTRLSNLREYLVKLEGLKFEVDPPLADADLSTYDRLIGSTLGVKEATEKTSAKIKELKEQLEGLRAGTISTKNVRKDIEVIEGQVDELAGALKLLRDKKTPEKLEPIQLTPFEIPPIVAPKIDTTEFQQSAEEFESVMLDWGGGLAMLATELAYGIGEAFESGDWSNLGSGLLGALGGFISQFGEMLISAGLASEALQVLIKNPLLAIAAGMALVALGSAVSARAQKNVSAFTGGSTATAGAGANSYNQTSNLGQSAYQGAYQDNWGEEVVFKIGNNELVGVLENASNRRNRL